MGNYTFYLKCIVAIVIIIICVVIGGFIGAKTNLFGIIGLHTQSDLRAAGDKVNELIGQLEERDRIFGELSSEYQRRIKSDEAFYAGLIAEERSRADTLAEQNRILRSGIESIGRGEGKTGEGLQGIERVWKLIDEIEAGIQQLREGRRRPDPALEDHSDR